MLRSHVILAVFKRNVASYFNSVLGYLFIVVFVVAGAALAFSPQFFTNNLATLDQLNEWFPMLLLFLVPAITMGVWADEKKSGTEELLFTLPASDVEILLGKYLSVLSVYTVAILFSFTHLGVLGYHANPDWGLLFANYFGYWIAGAALLSAGMFASVLTNSATVAFVLGAAICAVPVFIGAVPFWSDFFRQLSLSEQFREFGMGMVPLGSILYFTSLTVFMLYLNLVFIKKRHWSGGQQANMGLQFVVRSVALAAILISLSSLAAYGTFRADLTAERLYSLSPTTRTLLNKIDSQRPVTIQAFLSPDVPREYVPVRKRLFGLLRQYDQLGGKRVDVRFVDVKPFSPEAQEARHFGINPVRVRTERDGRHMEEDVYLGVVVSSSFDEVVVPFFGAGTPIEYELTRSVSTVSNEQRLTVGVLATDANVIGPSSEWQIVTELKQQYKVEEVSPDSPIDENKYDVLIAVLPSSLTQPQMTYFVDYVRKGKPVLAFDDPFPWVFNTGWGVSNAPRQPKPSPGGMGMMQFQQQQAPPKADGGRATTLLNALGIAWDNGEIVWDQYNPHPEFAQVPPEFLFISPKSGARTAFSQTSEITSGLQEMLAAFAGTIRPRSDSDLNFEPLLRTGPTSGLLAWENFTEQGFDMTRFQPTARLAEERRYFADEDYHVLAAHVTSKSNPKINVVYVADVDLISDWFFYERSRGESNLKLDNVTFVLNSVDVLAGDTSYIDLRKRRASLRTLLEVEKQKDTFIKERLDQEENATQEAEKELEQARERFEKQRTAIENDPSIDGRAKTLMLQNIKATEERRLEVQQANIEQEKKNKIDAIKDETERRIKYHEDQIRLWAVLLSPWPAILLGVFVLSLRLQRERSEITPERHVTR